MQQNGQGLAADEQVFLKRMADLARRASQKGIWTLSAFGSPRETELARIAAKRESMSVHAYGGFPGAERVRVLFADAPDVAHDAYEIACLTVTCSVQDHMTHGQVLGSILGLGLNRDVLGDLLVTGNTAHVFCTEAIKPFLLSTLSRVGPHAVHVVEARESLVLQGTFENWEEHQFTVSSLRLDAFLAHAFSMSRSKAVEPIHAGLVQVNHRVRVDPAFTLREGDVISLRGFGRAKVIELAGTSKKGRLVIRAGRLRSN
ncbi:RNA-binding protein [Ferroacidibacillus organovorans]|uniref:RNA-binding S4 domain-containing protein n=1 Tax=Ferroacidibacillus organovorans TaxID=1765683 RepID=A0A161QHZ7_9BACL|nr:YlmH/Sll1252 family protein [Ferroacidibacillus organovorans]KYP81830.1 hypothetical protein AYJ22_05565 [Ferroacidibacillus organovorans]OAG94176.1 hypothetical protein AYW79_06595 [Ferroacidibacillus organovorans]OPG16206.1 hypothetical protein B2M26_07795 [Ferroacidibacillus organovorans]